MFRGRPQARLVRHVELSGRAAEKVVEEMTMQYGSGQGACWRVQDALRACDAGLRVQKHSHTEHSSRQLPPINPRDTVRVKEGAWATKGQVLQATTYLRSYNIITEDGTFLRRNRRHLLPSRESFRQRGFCESEEDLRQGADETT
ncbi:hypothetical protein HPB49_007665 [Dermacentor silvarum]|uniref:Uncharacterized protein n=1 Tax=Dermacentor silvarum TaxID=543639 RepID=A0ACB8D3U0_DERSI|nr:hypothetical protein HPB49_007665 [Dermacentor silvarum]